jgi:hypothetical protein
MVVVAAISHVSSLRISCVMRMDVVPTPRTAERTDTTSPAWSSCL